MKPFLIFLLIFIASPLFATPLPDACWKHPEFVQSLPADTAEALFARLPKEKLRAVFDDGNYFEVYPADVMNDGHNKYVFSILHQRPNSAGPFNSTVFFVEENNGKLKWLGEVPRPAAKQNNKDCIGCPWWYDYTYEGETITKLCGLTYLVLDVKVYRVLPSHEQNDQSHRDAYIIKNHKTEDACDDNWARYEYNDFSKADANDADAISAFQFYLDKCKKQMTPSLYAEFSTALAKRSAIPKSKLVVHGMALSPSANRHTN